MASISQGIVLTTAMLLSSTIIYLAFSRQKTFPPFQDDENSDSAHSKKQILRSCLYSEERKREKRRMKKKRVKFAENVMVKEVERDSNGENREKQRKQNRASTNNCKNEIPESGGNGMPANRKALYNGILRDRVQRMACCH